jgi:two-component system, NarL family, sensor histidine kinase LiaS
LTKSSVSQVARKLHDGLAQDLVALGYKLDQSLGRAELPIETRVELRALRFEVTALIEKVRREILNLRQPAISIQEIAQEICGDKLGVLQCSAELTANQISVTAELLRNSITHSGASLINLLVEQDEEFIIIEVSDNGNGRVEMKANHFGLLGVGDAVAEEGGQILFSDLAPGLLVRITLPR